MDPKKDKLTEDKLTEDKLSWVPAIQDFTDKLTITRIVTALFAGIMFTGMMMVYENRDLIFEKIYNTGQRPQPSAMLLSVWDVTPKTKEDLISLVKGSSLISFALITEVDLQKNRSTAKHWFLDDPNEAQIRARASTALPQAVFDYDAKNTQQMVGVLNNDFVCAKFTDTIYVRSFPDLAKRVPVICRIAIPPFYGKFVGILTFGLRVQPTKDELDSIRLEASRLAVEIYLRDILKKQPTK